MKDILFIIVTLVTYAYSQNVGNNISIYRMKAVVVKCETKSQYDAVIQFRNKPGYDFLPLLSSISEPIKVLVTDNNFVHFQTILEENHITYEVVHDDYSEVIIEDFKASQTSRHKRDQTSHNDYPSYSEILESLKDYEKYRPKEAMIVDIGQSSEGRRIVGMKFSWGGQNKPCIIIDAGIHGRDWIATSAALTIISEFARKSENGHIYKDVDIYVFPVLNPDGYEYSRLSPETRLWKKTRSVHPGSQCVGTDLDRNFNIHWNSRGGFADPCSETYPGPKVLSELEAEALTDFMSVQKDIRAYLSLRSYGSNILYPYAYTFQHSENIDELKCVAKEAKQAMYRVRKMSYSIGAAAVHLDQSGGNSFDYALVKANAKLSYVMHLSTKKFRFTPPSSEMVPVGLEVFKTVEILSLYAKGNLCSTHANNNRIKLNNF